MQILVMYFSHGGHTRKLAQAIAQGVEQAPGAKALLKECHDVTREDFINSGGVIAGSPVYFGTMAGELKSVFDKLITTRRKMENKIGAAFATSADPSGGKETTIMSIIQAMLIYGMIVAGDPLEATGHYGTSCVGAPTEKDLDNAAKLGKRVATLAQKLNS